MEILHYSENTFFDSDRIAFREYAVSVDPALYHELLPDFPPPDPGEKFCIYYRASHDGDETFHAGKESLYPDGEWRPTRYDTGDLRLSYRAAMLRQQVKEFCADYLYIHSEEFTERFGDWEKANRLEDLRKAVPLEMDGQIVLNGDDITDTVDSLINHEDRKSLQSLEKEIGRSIIGSYMNEYTGLQINVSNRTVTEIANHHYLFKEHILALANVPDIIRSAVYIGQAENEDKAKHPNIQEYLYFGTGLKINGSDYTCKSVVGIDESKNCYYDQSLSTIEKGKLIDYVFGNKKAGNLSPLITQRETSFQSSELPYVYYDKRLLNICQVPQRPYLEQDFTTGKWQPAKGAVDAVRAGMLRIERHGQSYDVITNESKQEISNQTWTWKDYDDLSGHLEAPDGTRYFAYDWTTPGKDFKVRPGSGYSFFAFGTDGGDTSLAAFKRYAETYVLDSILQDSTIEPIFRSESIKSSYSYTEEHSVRFSEKTIVFSPENPEEFRRYSELTDTSVDNGTAYRILSALAGARIQVCYEPVPDALTVTGDAGKLESLGFMQDMILPVRSVLDAAEKLDNQVSQADFNRHNTDIRQEAGGEKKMAEEKRMTRAERNARAFLACTENGEQPFLKGTEDGKDVIIHPEPVYSAVTGKNFRGANQLLAQLARQNAGIESQAFITYEEAKQVGATLMKSGKEHQNTFFTLTTVKYNHDAIENKAPEFHNYTYFPVTDLVSDNDREKIKNHPNYKERPAHAADASKESAIDARGETDPDRYLGKYLAATSLQRTFLTDRETQRGVQEKLAASLRTEFGKNNFSEIFKLGNRASEVCKVQMKAIYQSMDKSRAASRAPVGVQHEESMEIGR